MTHSSALCMSPQWLNVEIDRQNLVSEYFDSESVFPPWGEVEASLEGDRS